MKGRKIDRTGEAVAMCEAEGERHNTVGPGDLYASLGQSKASSSFSRHGWGNG